MRNFKEYLYYLIKRRSCKAHNGYYRDYYRGHLDAFRDCAQKKESQTIKREMAALRKYWRCYPYQYYRYRFYRADCPLTLEQMKDYLPDFFAYYLFYPTSFKERNVLCEDKRLMYMINRGAGISQPRTLLFTENSGVFSETFDPVGTAECQRILDTCTADKIFVKPTFGVGGKGISVFNRQDGRFIERTSGTVLDAQYVAEISAGAWLIQEGIRQGAYMNTIYPHAINTCRVVTRCEDDRVEIAFALLRMGCGGMQIDNASSGGIYLKIDPATGEMGSHAVNNTLDTHTEHPDTHFIFGGTRLPMWEQIADFARTAARKYAPIRYIGWDIACSENGPVLIEGNNGPDISILQDHHGGLRRKLGVDNPDDYWYAKNYSLKNL